MARFIAAIPFLARCGKATETSFAHLLIYLASLDASAKQVFFHKPEDDREVHSRLSPILNFQGGNEATLLCCRDLLALCMVSNYHKDAEADRDVGKYNPFNTGVWDVESIIADLKTSIEKRITSDIAEFYTIEEALQGSWQE
jgi:hypothetical protein